MEIRITKGKNRNTLTCKRTDGSLTSENLGPNLPNHDIAHYVVETKYNMTNGFYGKLKSGMSIAELSDKNIIKNLDSDVWLSEIMARNLQSISSGGSTIEQYIELINWETKNMKGIKVPNMTLTDIQEMKNTFDYLCKKWGLVAENKHLKLTFE